MRGFLAGILLLGALGCAPQGEPPSRNSDSGKGTGGRLVTALRAEPRTLNPITAVDRPALTVIHRMTSELIHMNRVTQQSEGYLAESWTLSEDSRRFTLALRRGVRFSDGEPFDADDVVFTFQVLLDEQVASPMRSVLVVGGEPVQVRKLSSHGVEVELAAPYASGELFFDSIPILPEHRLAGPYREGRLAETWGFSTLPEEVVGLGPFQLARYQPGEQVVLVRNPYYWKVDSEGRRLPYLDEMVFVFVPSEDAQVIRFKTGETHVIDHLSAASFHLLARETGRGYVMRDLGAGLEFSFLFFNLNDVDADRLPEVARKQVWFRRRAFRQAVSAAIDRDAIVRLVFEGRATAIASHVSPGNSRWTNEAVVARPQSIALARELLTGDGFSWDEAGTLRDPQGMEVELSIVTNASNSQRVQMATIIQEDLRRLGIRVRVAALEFGALIDRVTQSFDYEASILSLTGDLDPTHFANVFRSDGNNRLWRLSSSSPEPAWQVEIDRLIDAQATLVDHESRKKAYDRVQAVLAEEEPVILLVSPNVLVGARENLGNFNPSIFPHTTLWNADELYWLDEGGRR